MPLFFALLGFLSPAHRGGLLQPVILIFLFMGAMAGNVPAKISEIWNSEEQESQWKLTIFLTAPLFPGSHSSFFFMLNFLTWKRNHLVQCLSRPCLLSSSCGLEFLSLLCFSEHTALSGKPVKLPVRTTIFHVTYQGNSSCCPQSFSILSVALCHLGEIGNHFDGSLVSRDHLHRVLHAEPLIWGRRSSGAVPFTTMFALLVLWLGISVPFVFLGAYFAVRETGGAPSANQPYSTSISRTTVRAVPKFFCFVSGIVPFCAVYTELIFIMSSLGNISSFVSSIYLLLSSRLLKSRAPRCLSH